MFAVFNKLIGLLIIVTFINILLNKISQAFTEIVLKKTVFYLKYSFSCKISLGVDFRVSPYRTKKTN